MDDKRTRISSFHDPVMPPATEREFATTPEERYDVRSKLGAGGMATVYDAVDNDLRRHIAIKILKDEHLKKSQSDTDDRPASQRFIEEAQITGQLQHPNIVPVHEIGYDASGRLYFTMKRIEGETLGEIMDALRAGDPDHLEKYTHHRLVEVFIKICDAMRFAHARDVLHRDLKPDNIMVGRFGEVQVMDWGLAKVKTNETVAGSPMDTVTGVVSTDGGSPLNTIDGTISGTPAYMPPEQARGDTSNIDERTDIFLLGAMLYEMITLIPPYTAESSMRALIRAQKRDLLPPKEAVEEMAKSGVLADGTEVAEKAISRAKCFPRGLAAIAWKALAEKSSDRYQSVKAMARDLRAWRSDQPLSVYREAYIVRLTKWANRNRTAAISIGAAVVILLLSFSAFSWIRERVAAKESENSKELLSKQEQIAAHEKREKEALAEKNRLAEQAAERRKARDKAEELLSGAASVMFRAASISNQRARYQAMTRTIELAHAARQADPTFNAPYVMIGSVSYDLGRIVDARRYLLQSIEVADREGVSTDFSTFLATSTVLLSEGAIFGLGEEVWVPPFVKLMERALESDSADDYQRSIAELFREHLPRMLEYQRLAPSDPKREALEIRLREDAERFLTLQDDLANEGATTYWELSLMAAWNEIQPWRHPLSEMVEIGGETSVNRSKALVQRALEIRPQLPIATLLISYLEIEAARFRLRAQDSSIFQIMEGHISTWREYRDRFPYDAVGRYSFAGCFETCGFGRVDAPEGVSPIEELEMALQFAPNLTYARAELAETLEHRGDRAGAAKHFAKLRKDWDPSYDFIYPENYQRALWRSPMARAFFFEARADKPDREALRKLYQEVLNHPGLKKRGKDYYTAIYLDALKLYQLVDKETISLLSDTIETRAPWVRVMAMLALATSDLPQAHALLDQVKEATPLDRLKDRFAQDRRSLADRELGVFYANLFASPATATQEDFRQALEARVVLSIEGKKKLMNSLRDKILAVRDYEDVSGYRKLMWRLYTSIVSQDTIAAKTACDSCVILDDVVEEYLRRIGEVGHTDMAR